MHDELHDLTDDQALTLAYSSHPRPAPPTGTDATTDAGADAGVWVIPDVDCPEVARTILDLLQDNHPNLYASLRRQAEGRFEFSGLAVDPESARDQRILRLYRRDKFTVAQIAAIVKVRREAVLCVLDQHHIPRPRPGPRPGTSRVELDIAEVLRLRDQGWTQKAIARHLGISQGFVSTRLAEHHRTTGATPHPRVQSPKQGQRSNTPIEEILHLREQGLSLTAIGRKVGVSAAAIGQRLSKHRRRTQAQPQPAAHPEPQPPQSTTKPSLTSRPPITDPFHANGQPPGR